MPLLMMSATRQPASREGGDCAGQRSARVRPQHRRRDTTRRSSRRPRRLVTLRRKARRRASVTVRLKGITVRLKPDTTSQDPSHIDTTNRIRISKRGAALLFLQPERVDERLARVVTYTLPSTTVMLLRCVQSSMASLLE